MSKYITSIVLFILILSTSVYSQRYWDSRNPMKYGVTNIKVGYFNPKDANGGLILGASLGTALDESVDICFGADLFTGSNKQEVVTGEETIGGVTEKQTYLDSESSMTLIPISGSVNVKIATLSNLVYTVGGGIGYGLLWTKEVEYDSNDPGKKLNSKSRFYHGFRWMLTGGLLYRVGTRSALIFEAFYDNAGLSRKKDGISYKVNLSGFGIRTGIRIGLL